MEDFELVLRLRSTALASGRLLRILPAAAVCSGRRWAKNGVLWNTMLNQWFVFAYCVLGWSADDIYRCATTHRDTSCGTPARRHYYGLPS